MVQIKNLEPSNLKALEDLMDSAQDKAKLYCAVVRSKTEIDKEVINKINNLVDIKVQQMTPI